MQANCKHITNSVFPYISESIQLKMKNPQLLKMSRSLIHLFTTSTILIRWICLTILAMIQVSILFYNFSYATGQYFILQLKLWYRLVFLSSGKELLLVPIVRWSDGRSVSGKNVWSEQRRLPELIVHLRLLFFNLYSYTINKIINK